MPYKLGLIGYPVGHSLSPWIHGEFLQRANLKGTYEKYQIEPGETFGREIKALMDSGIHGFNITVPHKETIIPYLDEVSDAAKVMGAVNTVVCENGVWTGHNTDGSGYVRSLHSDYPELADTSRERTVLMIGAGGAARGIYYALIEAGYQTIDFANRTTASAEEIAASRGGNITTQILTLTEAEENLANYDIIIQTTSVGMKPNENAQIMQLNHVKPGAIVSDIVYQPLETQFLKQAKSLGASIHFGHTMLLYQAQYAFEIWTGKDVSAIGMGDELKQILEGASTC